MEDFAFVFSTASSLVEVPRVAHKYDEPNSSVWHRDRLLSCHMLKFYISLSIEVLGLSRLVRTMQMNYWSGIARTSLLYMLYV